MRNLGANPKGCDGELIENGNSPRLDLSKASRSIQIGFQNWVSIRQGRLGTCDVGDATCGNPTAVPFFGEKFKGWHSGCHAFVGG